jgi:hypothetical protein
MEIDFRFKTLSMDKIDIYDAFIEHKANFLISFIEKFSIKSGREFAGRLDVIENLKESDHKVLRAHLRLHSSDYVTYLGKHFYDYVDESVWSDVDAIVNSAK